MSEPLHFYKNSGDGSFIDVSKPSKLSEQTGGQNLFATDFNNDGDIDFLITRGSVASSEAVSEQGRWYV
jgi:hypothetical protein